MKQMMQEAKPEHSDAAVAANTLDAVAAPRASDKPPSSRGEFAPVESKNTVLSISPKVQPYPY